MSKPAAIFVAAAMAVTAACVGVIASYGLGLDFGASALFSVAALALMAVTHLAFLRAQPKDETRLDDIDRALNELQSRFETLEIRLSTLDGGAAERARAAAKPLVDEIAALGGLVTSIAKEVASHDVAIARLAAPRPEPASQPYAPPAQQQAPAAPAPTPTLQAPPEPGPRPAATPVHAQPSAQPKIAAPEPLDLDAPVAADDLTGRIRTALKGGRIEPHLQPIVALPSRRTAHYEAFARLSEDDGLLVAGQFLGAAATAGLVAEIDRTMAEACAAVALRVSARGGGSVFLNLASETLRDARAVNAIAGLVETRGELARLIVPELSQAAFLALGVIERAAVERLIGLGVRLSLDEASDLRLDPRELNRRGVRFVKVRAERLLDPDAVRGASIHPADLSSLLARHGVDLIATHVEEERTTPELLDMDVRFGQGTLFGAPRPVRPAAPEAEPATPPTRLVPRSAAR